MKKVLFFTLMCGLCAFVSCNKDEGEGGTASISGYVYKVIHSEDDFSLSTDTIPAVKENVYIYYGSNKEVGDKVETGYDGYFKFKNLNKGNYEIFAYSTYDSGEKEAEKANITISRGDNGNVGTIYIHEGKAYGTSMIKGCVKVNYYLKDYGEYISEGGKAIDYIPAETRVYLSRVGDPIVLDDTRTSYDGSYVFQRLQKGEYVIYAYSPDMKLFEEYAESILKPVFSDTIKVDESGKIFEAEVIRIVDIK